VACATEFSPSSIDRALVKTETYLEFDHAGWTLNALNGGDDGIVTGKKPKVGHDERERFACVRPGGAIAGNPRHFMAAGRGLTILGPSAASEEA